MDIISLYNVRNKDITIFPENCHSKDIQNVSNTTIFSELKFLSEQKDFLSSFCFHILVLLAIVTSSFADIQISQIFIGSSISSSYVCKKISV